MLRRRAGGDGGGGSAIINKEEISDVSANSGLGQVLLIRTAIWFLSMRAHLLPRIDIEEADRETARE